MDEVSSLVANTSVVNGGNTSVAPPQTAWRLFWNTIAGWAERAWSAVLAVSSHYSLLKPVADALGVADKFMSATSLIADLATAIRLARG